jgi:hypothetical protein
VAIQEESDEDEEKPKEEGFKVSKEDDEPVITEEPAKPKITEVKSEEQSSWWKPGNKDNLNYDDYKP